MANIYIGLISGTSVDNVDAVAIEFIEQTPRLLATHSEAIPTDIKQAISDLCLPGHNEIDRLGVLDKQIGQLFALAVKQLITSNQIDAQSVVAIGSHGQTIRHRSNTQSDTFSLQIGDPNTIAELTGYTTVADFRRRDIAAGGQGAPLAPAFHLAITPNSETCVFLNLGGIANITLIHNKQLISGFDTGPANGLMDAWINKHKNMPCDTNGQWAKSGTVHPALLKQLKSHAYFFKSAPKSTGREEFSLPWLEGVLKDIDEAVTAEDVQATLLQFSCETIADEIKKLPFTPSKIYCCGGGVHNTFFMQQLGLQFVGIEHLDLTDTSELGIAPDWIEASAFAWLAQKNLNQQKINLEKITGAKGPRIAGAVFQA